MTPELLLGGVVSKGSFYDRLARVGPELIKDEDFAGLYAAGRGRPSIPPSVVMKALLLATRDGTSDRESARRTRADLDWKHALGLDVDHGGIGATTFSLLRSRLRSAWDFPTANSAPSLSRCARRVTTWTWLRGSWCRRGWSARPTSCQ